MTGRSALIGVLALIWSFSDCPTPVQAGGQPWKPTGKETAASMLNRASAANRPKEVGVYYKAVVPDTLDLAERARLGLNHFTSITRPERDYEMYWRGDFVPADPDSWPGHMSLLFPPLFACQPKAMEAMAMLRTNERQPAGT